MAEPLPTRDNRQSILFYEAAEGGAGVLTRLATESSALATVAAEALEIMHFKRPAGGQSWVRAALDDELGDDGQPLCEAGCYKCLLSYYNQPDHPLIDRQDKEAGGLVLGMLCRLTQSEAKLGTHGRAPKQHSAELARTAGSSLEHAGWLMSSNMATARPWAAHHRLGADLRRLLLRRIPVGGLHRRPAHVRSGLTFCRNPVDNCGNLQQLRLPMSTVNFSVPEEVKRVFNETFQGQNKSAIIADLMREAVERARSRQRSEAAGQRILERRKHAPAVTDAEFRAARESGRQ